MQIRLAPNSQRYSYLCLLVLKMWTTTPEILLVSQNMCIALTNLSHLPANSLVLLFVKDIPLVITFCIFYVYW